MKKLAKRIALVSSIVITSILGFLINFDQSDKNDYAGTVLKEPIFSIEKLSVKKAGASDDGDCCSSSCESYPVTSAGVTLSAS